MLDIKPEQMAQYIATAQKRAHQEQSDLHQRYRRAHQVAQQAASLLKAHFTVGHIVVFGSLVHQALFHLRSDIDLAVWGLPERDYYRAVGELQALDPAFAIDLIRFEEASPTLQATIEQDGVTL